MSDPHPDAFYKVYSSTEREDACHHGIGPAGALGAETTDCDSPMSLINATFRWIDEHLKDSIDFVVWTGDSARHDNDEEIPRTIRQVEGLNELLVTKFVEVFGKDDNLDDDDPTNDLIIPIIPTFGNNDILPHNILTPGPNRWTKSYLEIWKKFIPEEQRHAFDHGGWFVVEVIPNKLAVFSLNTLFFYASNTAVYGCARETEPGYEHFEWLRVQLQFLRQRGMKAIISGHVPPARTPNKSSWDETCWQKYTLWMQQYRDIVIGSIYGHMNIDHFMLQDFNEIDFELMNRRGVRFWPWGLENDDRVTIASTSDYLTDLRSAWSRLPNIKLEESEYEKEDQDAWGIGRWRRRISAKRKQSDHEKLLGKIGGRWGERYSATLVSPSVVPNYFPTLRVIEYNITGLDVKPKHHGPDSQRRSPEFYPHVADQSVMVEAKKHRAPKAKKPKFITPDPPSKSSPPGPAYSPQTFTWLSFAQYYANLTTINNDFPSEPEAADLQPARWHNGKHSGKQPHSKVPKDHTKEFKYEMEYDTKTDKTFQLRDLTMRSVLDLAARIGRHAPPHSPGGDYEYESSSHCDEIAKNNPEIEDKEDSSSSFISVSSNESNEESRWFRWRQEPKEKGKGNIQHSKHKKHKKHHHGKGKGKEYKLNNVWFTFLRRAFVGAKDDDDLRDDFELS